jgi:hypothetical protein
MVAAAANGLACVTDQLIRITLEPARPLMLEGTTRSSKSGRGVLTRSR